MKLLKHLVAAAALASMAATPALAQTAASKLSLRSATPAKTASDLRGGFIIPLVAVVAIILGVVVATRDKSTPASP